MPRVVRHRLLVLLPLAGLSGAGQLPLPAASPPAAASATADGPTDPRELGRFVDSVIAAGMEKEHIPGAAFVFVKDGKVFYAKGYGHANLEQRRPVDPERTIWRIGSISKVFTAQAVVGLAERGRLDLSADVNRYLGRLQLPATFPQPVTAEHLITHTAGLDEIRPGTQAEDSAGVLPLAEFLRPRLVRNWAPGRVLAYSTYGITLAGLLVEEVSGEPFERHLRERIWRPLGMTRTSITVPDEMRGDVAMGYEYEGGKHVPQRWEWYHTTPASSINSTAADMARWLIAHVEGARAGGSPALGERATRDMHRRHFGAHPEIGGVAYGFFEALEPGSPRFVEHGGNMAGFSSQAVLLPEQRAAFFLVNHGEPTSLRETVKWALLGRYYHDSSRVVPPPRPDTANAASVSALAGTYGWVTYCHSCTPAQRPWITPRVGANPDGTLSLQGRKWVQVRPMLFVREDGKAKIAFTTDSAGRATYLYAGTFWVFERLRE